jgi:hypothetical protein
MTRLEIYEIKSVLALLVLEFLVVLGIGAGFLYLANFWE